MEKVGDRKIWSYFDDKEVPRQATNWKIRRGNGHPVKTYFRLARKVAELQFLNQDHVLLFRGQERDFRTSRNGSSLLKPSIFRLNGKNLPTKPVLKKRFDSLRSAESELVSQYIHQGTKDLDRIRRHRIIRWAILQHYGVCATPLLDVTQSLRIAASFASHNNETTEAFVFALAVPNLSGAVTASSEAGLQIIRLSSACPPSAVRPHIQEGLLMSEYPEISDYRQNANYRYFEMDFGRRLVAKFRFNPNADFWSGKYPQASYEALHPKEPRDPLIPIMHAIRSKLGIADATLINRRRDASS